MNLAALVTRYARRFSVIHRSGHSVSSPLGAWLVMAVAVHAADDAPRAELEDLLGLDARAARDALDDLLAEPPTVLRAAIAAWSREPRGWIDGLPAAVQTGTVPERATLDAWAREHTDGLIDRFPVSDPGRLDLLLASALATRLSWTRPFGLADAHDLRTPWRTAVRQVLFDGDADGALIDTELGTVAVHTAAADGGLMVTSVIADQDAVPRDVVALAHDIATGACPAPRALADVPLGDHGHFEVVEEKRVGGDGYRAYLPAWEAKSDHDLMADPQLGFRVVGNAVGAGKPVDARQSAVARYGQYGFEAAAITTVAVRSAFVRPSRVRVATLRYGHPYAVVAVVRDGRGPWAGMPVFAAWVAEPSEPDSIVMRGQRT